MTNVKRVLVVDDSAYVRKMVGQMLSRSPFLEVVGTARDGKDALELAQTLQPDVITCHLNMPERDGVAFFRAQMAPRPFPIVIISVASGAGEQVLAALDAGAVDFLQKPTALATDRLLDVSEELIAKVKAAAGAPVARLPDEPVAVATVPRRAGDASARAVDVVVLGVSRGGPPALQILVPA